MKFAGFVLITIVFAQLLTGCGGTGTTTGGNEKEGHITISGAFALYPMAVTWAKEFGKENPGVKIDISAGGEAREWLMCSTGW